MKRPGANSLILVISLIASVIWHGSAFGSVAPVLESLGQIKDYQRLQAPTALAVDGSGVLYIADTARGVIVAYDRYGAYRNEYRGVPVSGRGLAVTSDGTRIYVASGNSVALIDAQTGDVQGYLGVGAGEFGQAGEIALDDTGFVFVGDQNLKVVKVYGPAGKFQYEFGAGLVVSISSLSVDSVRGEVYVADSQTDGATPQKVRVFDLAGNLKRSYLATATAVLGSPYMTFFGGIAFDDSGRAYFLESFYSQLRFVDTVTSAYLGKYSKVGYTTGLIHRPFDAVYDPGTKRLFVSCEGARVEIFGVDGGQTPVYVNDPPTMPILISPSDGGEVNVAGPVLEYENSVDPEGSEVVCEIRLVDDLDVEVARYEARSVAEGTTSIQVVESLVENAHYRWSVQASDGEKVSGWTEPRGFWLNAENEPPAAPVPALFAPGMVLDGSGILSWAASVDPDPFDEVLYTVEVIGGDGTVVLTSDLASLSIALTDFEGYSLLEDGATYAWRVQASDDHGLASAYSETGTFLYDTTILEVTTNMPDADIYVGGNLAYTGSSLGSAPLTLRDFVPGTYSVVVERAGFEPWVSQVRVAERENVALYAELTPAIKPADLRARPMEVAGEKIDVGSDAAPFLVDFDNDGVNDLLVGSASGAITLYKGRLVDGVESLSAGVALGVPLLPGAAPFVVDWNNDGRKDILTGAADGTVTLFANNGLEESPTFGDGLLLQVAGEPIDVGSDAVPAVIDLEGDGDKDLLVGSASGTLNLYKNTGTDSDPVLEAPVPLLRLSSAIAPFFADWDGDGKRDLLLAAGEHLYRYVLIDGQYDVAEVLTVGPEILGGSGAVVSGAYVLGGNLRLFACDIDGMKGKDLLVGNAAGEVRVARSSGTDYVVTFISALEAKLAQIESLDDSASSEVQAQVSALGAALAASDYIEAKRLLELLVLSTQGDLAFALEELKGLLNK